MNTLGVVVVTTAGTSKQLTTNTIVANEIWIQPMKDLGVLGTSPTQNAGTIYLKTSTTTKGATSTDILLALDAGQNAISLRSKVPNGFDLSKLYLDADNSLDGALISYV